MGKRQMGRQHRGMDEFELHVMIAEDREANGNSLAPNVNYNLN